MTLKFFGVLLTVPAIIICLVICWEVPLIGIVAAIYTACRVGLELLTPPSPTK